MLKESISGRLANVSDALESGKAGQAVGFRKFWGVNALRNGQRRRLCEDKWDVRMRDLRKPIEKQVEETLSLP